MLTSLKRAVKESIDVLPHPFGGLICRLIECRDATPATRAGERSALRLQRQFGCGTQVASGPFAGMEYLTSVPGGAWLPKVLGTYELEIAPAIEECATARFETIVDIGAAEGYYAVGMARRCPQANVICFEYYPPARRLLDRMARVNGVRGQLSIHSECTPERLAETLTGSGPTLVISDCEGAEDHLLDPVRVPALRKATLLVEMHDAFCPGVTERVCERFAESHEIVRFAARERAVTDFPGNLAAYSPQDALDAMYESKANDMLWLYLKPRTADWRPPQPR